jgi:hypothetical protein
MGDHCGCRSRNSVCASAIWDWRRIAICSLARAVVLRLAARCCCLRQQEAILTDQPLAPVTDQLNANRSSDARRRRKPRRKPAAGIILSPSGNPVMTNKPPPAPRPVSIALDGRHYRGNYVVEQGMITVSALGPTEAMPRPCRLAACRPRIRPGAWSRRSSVNAPPPKPGELHKGSR